ncbi:MAG: FKBP-type peptidyl-prolyl cis-trans isomerase [Bacteroidia bacterium]
MIKTLSLIALSLLSTGLLAQKQKSKNENTTTQNTRKLNTEITTPSGLKYKITEAGSGRKIEVGDKVTVHYTGKLTNGFKFDSSLDRQQPFSFKVGSGQVIRGWDEGLALLNVGDKATLTIPPSLGYGMSDMGSIPANSTLIFDIEVLDAKQSVSAKPFDVAGKDTLKTASGLKYIYVNKGSGTQAQNGKTVSVHYTGYLLDGRKFDSSVEREEPIQFPLGQGMVIRGWEEGIALMKVGDKMRLIIPSELGYGERGAGGVIPPNATLIFDVELMDVK